MRISRKKLAAVASLAVVLSIASWGVLSQSNPAAEASVAEVQTYIEQRVRENRTLDDVVASGLTLGYRPEVLAAALLILNFEPATVAVALVNQGVSRRDAAQFVITVAGPPSSEPVLQALLRGSTTEEGTVLRNQVREIVSSISPVVVPDAQAPVQQVPAQAEAAVTDATAPASEAASSTASTSTAADAQAPNDPVAPGAPPATDTAASPPVAPALPTTTVTTVPPALPPLLVGIAPPTPPVQGGGGGATRN